MKKINNSKAFTLLELMVSIFITIVIIASFYKLYNASIKTERSAAIRSGVNLMGEQILDILSESFRLVGLNADKFDFMDGDVIFPEIKVNPISVQYLSPYGSPITKVVTTGESTDPGCSIELFNSASFYSGLNQLYIHNQNGFFKANGTFSPASSTFQVSSFSTQAGEDGTPCKDIFPSGSLITGKDFRYQLTYSNDGSVGKINSLKLESFDPATGQPEGTLINFSYNYNKADNFYSMPKFIMEYLYEYECGADVCRAWLGGKKTDDVVSHVKDIIAVRFGFVLLSRKERVVKGNPSVSTGTQPKYCIFQDDGNDSSYCDTLSDLNYTASVFRRTVYLSNYRLLRDQVAK